MNTLTTTQKGFLRGIVYPLVAILFAHGLTYLHATGWFTDAGSLALTGLVAWIETGLGITPVTSKHK